MSQEQKVVAKCRHFTAKRGGFLNLALDYNSYYDDVCSFLTELGPTRIIAVDHRGGGQQAPYCTVYFWDYSDE